MSDAPDVSDTVGWDLARTDAAQWFDEQGNHTRDTEQQRAAATLVQKLQALQEDHDTESAHYEADQELMQFVRDLGYSAVADAYDLIAKWYS